MTTRPTRRAKADRHGAPAAERASGISPAPGVFFSFAGRHWAFGKVLLQVAVVGLVAGLLLWNLGFLSFASAP